ncbi:histidine phosphatase family protein [Microbacterium radiodurans]|uniref:Histidine phosphatase family protein n=1 Tax=Microbacterium radiodurans TaxID=661398 RepID=A0A5J5IQR8_9MICO|nr:histidine phosphatase family protein [Microbacterium radiodurans]KAA9086769.1 histidine phosphatase family protein [Microbacterium radiodurans]
MTILTLVRHGETDWNRERRIQGSTDIPLNETGRDQARAVGAALRAALPADAALAVASSDLARARETAELIASALEVRPPRTYAGLRERNYGDAEGVGIEEFHARWGEWAVADVPGAEPWPDVRRRALAALGDAVGDARRHHASASPDLVVVAHGALIREVIRHATGGSFPAQGVRLANGSIHTFRWERDRLSLIDSPVLLPA